MAARRSIGQFAELAPSRLTPRRMKGKTVASNAGAAAFPTAATFPHNPTCRMSPASSGPPTLSMTPPNRVASSAPRPDAQRFGRGHFVRAELLQIGFVLGAAGHGNHRVAPLLQHRDGGRPHAARRAGDDDRPLSGRLAVHFHAMQRERGRETGRAEHHRFTEVESRRQRHHPVGRRAHRPARTRRRSFRRGPCRWPGPRRRP